MDAMGATVTGLVALVDNTVRALRVEENRLREELRLNGKAWQESNVTGREKLEWEEARLAGQKQQVFEMIRSLVTSGQIDG